MTLTENFSPVLDLFPFSNIEHISVSMENAVFRIKKKNNEPAPAMELAVNNYLKTPEEIEREFHQATHVRIPDTQKGKDNSDHSLVSINKTDEFMIMHNADEILSGFMEENY